MNRDRLGAIAYDNQVGDLVSDAVLILTAIYPKLASVLWLHCVEQLTVVEVAKIWGLTERQIRRYLNGYSEKGVHVWGSKDWLGAILDLLVEAMTCKEGDELDRAFAFAARANPWGSPFPATMLDLLMQAQDRDALCCILDHLNQARGGGRYARFLDTVLERYDRQNLESFLAELCPPKHPDRDTMINVKGQPT